MKPIFFGAALCALTTPAFAQSDLSARVAADGLASTVAYFENLENPDASDHFALGATLFLRGLEVTFQERYRTGLVETELGLPGLSLPLPPNQNPDPFTPDMIESLFVQLDTYMERSRTALAPITPSDEVAVEVDLAQLWFDINSNAVQDQGEDLITLGLLSFLGEWRARETLDSLGETPLSPVRFDTADAAWLAAYTHLLSGTAQMVQAFEPTGPITDVMQAAIEMDRLRNAPAPGIFGPDNGEIDLIAVVVATLEQQPDPAHTRAAHANFTEMMAQNRIFWTGVAAETDNKREWIPSAKQSAALPITFPEATSEAWLAVLDDADAILQGDLLIPHWRLNARGMTATAGINFAAWMQDPGPVDIMGFIHGHALMPYIQEGPTADFQSLQEFERLMGRNTGMFMFMLN